MPSIQKGTFAIAWSLATTISGATAGFGTCTVQSVDYAAEAENKGIRHADGLTKCLVFFDHAESCTVEVIPSSTTKALAQAANVLPTIGGDADIADSLDSEIVGSTAGLTRWHVMSARKRKTTDGEPRLTFELKRYETDLPTLS